VSRNTVRKMLRSDETSFEYERERAADAEARSVDRTSSTGCWPATSKSAREQLTLIRIYEELRALGYDGGYDAVRRYAAELGEGARASAAASLCAAELRAGRGLPVRLEPRDRPAEGVTVTVKVAHVRLCHSRMLFVRAYPRETQEMVFDAHDRAFAFFGGACTRGIYDNMKTAVETVFVGKERAIQPPLPADVQPLPGRAGGLHAGGGLGEGPGREPGRVGARALLHAAAAVQELRGAERLAARSLRRLCQGASPSRAADRTIWECSRRSDHKLVPYVGRFDGFHAVPASVSKTCLVRFDNNKYSVSASAVGRPVEVHAYADRIVAPPGRRPRRRASPLVRPRRDGLRSLALRAGAGPQARRAAQRRAVQGLGAAGRDGARPAQAEAGSTDGDRQMVDILAAVLTDGLDGGGGGLRRGAGQGVTPPTSCSTSCPPPRSAAAANHPHPRRPELSHAPIADCARYDSLRRTHDLMERTEILDLMSDAQALRHAAAFDEIIADGRQAPARAPAHRRRPAEGRDRREAGALDQVPAHHRQAAARQGSRRLRVRRHAGQRDAGPRSCHRRLPRQQRNAVLVGGTGTGKTHLAIAIARSCIRGGARGRFYNVVDLVNRLEAEARRRRQGRSPTT
jgi:hypothetical protein